MNLLLHFYLMMENFEFEYDENEVKHNPWSVESIEEFRFYNCPECDYKESLLRDFVGQLDMLWSVIQNPENYWIH